MLAMSILIIVVFCAVNSHAQNKDAAYRYTDANALSVSGRASSVAGNTFHRVDTVFLKKLPARVAELSTNSAGIGISFITNSKNLKIKWVLGKYHTQWNMTPLAVNGLDLYTGLAYFNIIALMWDNIERDNHGELWINYKREKTEAGTLVPILGPSVAILEKHRANRVGTEPQAVFCWVSNQCVNKNLKIIAAVCRIRKYLTLHMESHTFATTITLMNDIPIETISKMMGHTKSALPCFTGACHLVKAL